MRFTLEIEITIYLYQQEQIETQGGGDGIDPSKAVAAPRQVAHVQCRIVHVVRQQSVQYFALNS